MTDPPTVALMPDDDTEQLKAAATTPIDCTGAVARLTIEPRMVGEPGLYLNFGGGGVNLDIDNADDLMDAVQLAVTQSRHLWAEGNVQPVEVVGLATRARRLRVETDKAEQALIDAVAKANAQHA